MFPEGSLQTKAKLYDHGLECVDERADPSAMMSAFYNVSSVPGKASSEIEVQPVDPVDRKLA